MKRLTEFKINKNDTRMNRHKSFCMTGFILAVVLSGGCTNISNDNSYSFDPLSTSAPVTEQSQEQNITIASDAEDAVTAFSLSVPGINGSVRLVPDMDMSEVLPLLGDSFSYYEAPSCAFRGMDKIYTFNNFQIDTYPDKETDRIYLISLLSDLVCTNEGLMIGSSESQIVTLYGQPQEMKGNEYIYQKDSIKLGIVAQNGTVAAITFYSTVN